MAKLHDNILNPILFPLGIDLDSQIPISGKCLFKVFAHGKRLPYGSVQAAVDRTDGLDILGRVPPEVIDSPFAVIQQVAQFVAAFSVVETPFDFCLYLGDRATGRVGRSETDILPVLPGVEISVGIIGHGLPVVGEARKTREQRLLRRNARPGTAKSLYALIQFVKPYRQYKFRDPSMDINRAVLLNIRRVIRPIN